MTLFSTLPDDPELQNEIAQAFLEEGPRLLLGIENAVAERNYEALAETAHALKGVLAQIGAEAAFDPAQKLELLAKTGNFEESKKTLGLLKLEMEHLQSALEEMVRAIG